MKTTTIPWIKSEGMAYKGTLGVPQTVRINEEAEHYLTYILSHATDGEGKTYRRSQIVRACLTEGLRSAYLQVKEQIDHEVEAQPAPLSAEEAARLAEELF